MYEDNGPSPPRLLHPPLTRAWSTCPASRATDANLPGRAATPRLRAPRSPVSRSGLETRNVFGRPRRCDGSTPQHSTSTREAENVVETPLEESRTDGRRWRRSHPRSWVAAASRRLLLFSVLSVLGYVLAGGEEGHEAGRTFMGA